MPHPPPGAPPQGHPPGYPPPGYPPPGYPHGAPPRQGIPGWGIALIVVGVGLLVVGILAAVAIPAFMKYMRRAKTTEAPVNLKKIFDGAKGYYEKSAAMDQDKGGRLPVQFPESVGLTPTRTCCQQSGRKCHNTDWSSPTWAALGFEITDPHYFQYRFSATGRDRQARFTAGAHADLDCDGILSTWERTGTVNAENRVVGARSIYMHQALE